MSSSNGSARPSPRNRLSSVPENPASLDVEARKDRAVQSLHEQFDRLNVLWAEKEKELVSMHVPQEVWHQYKSVETDSDGHGEDYYIGLAKWRGQWRLVWSWNDWMHPDDSDDTKPILEAALEDRIEAAAHFSTLREKVVKAAEKAIPKVEAAIAALST